MQFSKVGINEVATIRIIRQKDNGGAVVEMCIGTQTFDIHSNRTAGGGKKIFDVSTGVLDEMVHNFGRLPGPVAVYVGHIPEEMKAFTPAVGYVEALRRDGTSLFATIDLTPDGAYTLLHQEGFRSASMEFGQNVQTVNSEIAGWSLTGLALTNDPALAIVNKIAAGIAPLATIHTSMGQHYAVRLSLATTESDKESHMLTDKQIADLQAELVAKETELTIVKAEVEKLSAQVEAGKAEIQKLPASDSDSQDVIRNRSREYSKLAVELETVKQTNTELMDKMNSRDVLDTIENALEQGKVTPAEVVGYAENPMKWLSTNYGEAFTPAQLETLFSKRAVVVNTKDRKSSGNSFSQNLAGNLSRETQDGLRKLGLDPALASCHSAADAKRIADSKKGK